MKKIKLHPDIMIRIRCQEASTLSCATYIPCAREAVGLVENRDSYLYFMCDECMSHNVRNRGAKQIAQLESGVFGE